MVESSRSVVVRSRGLRARELVYVSFDWEHPPVLDLDPPLILEPGEGLRLEVTYDNVTDETVNFGFLSTDEMLEMSHSYYMD